MAPLSETRTYIKNAKTSAYKKLFLFFIFLSQKFDCNVPFLMMAVKSSLSDQFDCECGEREINVFLQICERKKKDFFNNLEMNFILTSWSRRGNMH
jgi:hypothetical protein